MTNKTIVGNADRPSIVRVEVGLLSVLERSAGNGEDYGSVRLFHSVHASGMAFAIPDQFSSQASVICSREVGDWRSVAEIMRGLSRYLQSRFEKVAPFSDSFLVSVLDRETLIEQFDSIVDSVLSGRCAKRGSPRKLSPPAELVGDLEFQKLLRAIRIDLRQVASEEDTSGEWLDFIAARICDAVRHCYFRRHKKFRQTEDRLNAIDAKLEVVRHIPSDGHVTEISDFRKAVSTYSPLREVLLNSLSEFSRAEIAAVADKPILELSDEDLSAACVVAEKKNSHRESREECVRTIKALFLTVASANMRTLCSCQAHLALINKELGEIDDRWMGKNFLPISKLLDRTGRRAPKFEVDMGNYIANFKIRRLAKLWEELGQEKFESLSERDLLKILDPRPVQIDGTTFYL